jgi:ABC-type glycerol-3-phosphate transport system substrate-binding protein
MRKGMHLAALMSLSLAAAALLGGCGSKTAGETNKAADTKEWVYVPEFIELED